MAEYDDLQIEKSSGGKLESFSQVSEEDVVKVKQLFPNSPEDYLSFLREIGFGEIGENVFMIYSGLTEADDVFDEETASEVEHILFFGDDFSGYNCGFDTSNGWCVVEVDSADMEVDKVADSFKDFVRNKLSSLG